MRHFYFFTGFAVFYLLIITIFQASAQSTSEPIEPQPGISQPVAGNASRPLFTLDQFGITDPVVRQNLQDIYGTLLGQPECVKKSICVMGNYMHDLPGRDIIFTFLGRYIPQEWGVLYDIFRVSIMYGQSCQIYVCNAPEAALSQNPSFLANLFQLSPGASTTTTPAPALNPTQTSTATPTTTTTTRPEILDNAINVHGGNRGF